MLIGSKWILCGSLGTVMVAYGLSIYSVIKRGECNEQYSQIISRDCKRKLDLQVPLLNTLYCTGSRTIPSFFDSVKHNNLHIF